MLEYLLKWNLYRFVNKIWYIAQLHIMVCVFVVSYSFIECLFMLQWRVIKDEEEKVLTIGLQPSTIALRVLVKVVFLLLDIVWVWAL